MGMIKNVLISNFILIESWNVDFNSGLNVITGETGAGKSILISAIDAALAGKFSKDVIKPGADKAIIELTVSTNNKNVFKILNDNEIEVQQEFVLSREISPNNSKYRIDGLLVNQNIIKEIRNHILDIHSQHQSYTFLQKKHHIKLLDAYSKSYTSDLLEKYNKDYKNYLDLKSKLVYLKNQSDMTESQIDFLKYQINEIEEANIEDINEDTSLNKELAILENAEKLKELTGSIYWTLSNDDNSILSALSTLKMNLSKAIQLDENLKQAESSLIDANEILRDLSTELRNYSQNLDNDTERLNKIQERLYTLEKIKRKYGTTLEDVLNTYTKLNNEYNSVENCNEQIEQTEKEICQSEYNLKKLAEEISEQRKKYAKILSSLIIETLVKLELPKCRFEISVKETDLCENGIDDVEFLISTNISEPLKPLEKVASGGEISRVMLALKSIFAQNDEIDTVIFDEIDTGISGKTSQSVADEISKLSKYRQIIMITHQAILAAKADLHLYIKKTQGKTTDVNIYSLNENDRINALAELASGEITQESLDFAKTLI